jgi:hypothetical protein
MSTVAATIAEPLQAVVEARRNGRVVAGLDLMFAHP